MRQKHYEYPHKCRCGAWLYNRAIQRGYCTRCGPEPVAEPAVQQQPDESEAADELSE